MTKEQYAKIKAVADDERTDPATRALAQKQVNKWRQKMEGTPKVVPGIQTSPQYRAWVKGLHIGKKAL